MPLSSEPLLEPQFGTLDSAEVQIRHPFLVIPRSIMIIMRHIAGHVENPKVKVTNLLKIFKKHRQNDD